MNMVMTYLGIVLLGAVKPGPGVTFFVTTTLSDGMKSSCAALLGCGLSHALMVATLLWGLDLSSVNTAVLDMVQAVALVGLFVYGALYLFKPVALGAADRQALSGGVAQNLLKGMIWPFTNPLNYAMYGALMPMLLQGQAGFSVTQMAALALATGAAIIMGVMPYVVLAHKSRDFLLNDAVKRNMNKVTGVFCMAIAALFTPKLIQSLFGAGTFGVGQF